MPRVSSSFAPRHTCQPAAHRSSMVQPAPRGRAPLWPAAGLHAGALDAVLTTPAADQPPAQPAIDGKLVVLVNASRVPSAQPMSATMLPPTPIMPPTPFIPPTPVAPPTPIAPPTPV